MAKITKLLDIVGRLSDFDEDDTIYAAEPWAEDSAAMVAPEPDEGLVPAKAAKAGLTYFIEVVHRDRIHRGLGCVPGGKAQPIGHLSTAHRIRHQ